DEPAGALPDGVSCGEGLALGREEQLDHLADGVGHDVALRVAAGFLAVDHVGAVHASASSRSARACRGAPAIRRRVSGRRAGWRRAWTCCLRYPTGRAP